MSSIPLYKLVVLGDGGVGKSSLVIRLTQVRFLFHPPHLLRYKIKYFHHQSQIIKNTCIPPSQTILGPKSKPIYPFVLQDHFVTEYDPTVRIVCFLYSKALKPVVVVFASPQIENSYRKQMTYEDEKCMLDVLDTGGRDDYSAMRDLYIREGHGFLICYSPTSRATFESAVEYVQRIYRIKEGEKVPVVMSANKCDLTEGREVCNSTLFGRPPSLTIVS